MATVTLTINTDNISASAVKNLVRRTLDKTEFQGETGEVKGIKYVIKPGKPASRVATIRAWAKSKNLPVGERGRLKPEVIAAYEASVKA